MQIGRTETMLLRRRGVIIIGIIFMLPSPKDSLASCSHHPRDAKC